MVAAGLRVRVMPQLKVEAGIQAARTMFRKCFFGAERLRVKTRDRYWAL